MPEKTSSLAILIGCLVWAPIAVWVYSLISWSIMGEIDALFGIVGAFLGIALGVAIMLQPHPSLAPYLVASVFTLVLVFPYLRSLLTRRELAQIDIESIERAYEQLGERPDGFGPKMRIARLIYGRGLRGHAITLAEEALKPFPRSTVEDDLRQLRIWKASATTEDFGPIRCLECGKENPVGTLFCRRCHSRILLRYAKGSWSGKRSARKLLSAWIASMAGLVGIPLAAIALPPVGAGAIVTILLGGSAILVYLAFKPEPAT